MLKGLFIVINTKVIKYKDNMSVKSAVSTGSLSTCFSVIQRASFATSM